uniref:Uncharacterized protein n=1 Tax=Arundo donax TaxID=35708 RepID=A0A0A9AYQ4_ARUDO
MTLAQILYHYGECSIRYAFLHMTIGEWHSAC